MVLVEVNRLSSTRDTAAGKAQIEMLELRNLVGMAPAEPLVSAETLNDVIAPLPPLTNSTRAGTFRATDLKLAKATESSPKLASNRHELREDWMSSVMAGYQRMGFGYPLNGINDAGQLGRFRNLSLLHCRRLS